MQYVARGTDRGTRVLPLNLENEPTCEWHVVG